MSERDPVVFLSVIPQGSKNPERIDLSDRLLTWSYEDDEAKADKFTMQIDNFDLRMLDAPIFAKGNVIEFSFGYPGNMSPVRSCVIKSCKGSMVLSIEALAKSVLMNTVRKTRTFEQAKRSDVAKQIAEEYGYGPELQHVDDTEITLDQVTQASMTDAQLLADMAKREGFVFFVDFDGFHFHARKLGQKPIREFVWYVDPGIGDVLNWTVDNDIYTARAGGITVKGRDPVKKTPIEATADNASNAGRKTLAPTVEVFTAINKRDGTTTVIERTPAALGSSTVQPTTAKTQDEAKRAAAGMYSGSQLAVVQLNVDAVADPQMLAKTIATVSGIGPTLSGNYYVKTVSFKGSPGLTMTMKMKRDGKSQASNPNGPAVGTGAVPSVPSTGSPNTAKPAKTGPDGKPADLLAVNKRDGSVVYTDTRGRGEPDDLLYGSSVPPK